MVGAALTSALPVLARTPWQLALLLGLLALFERSAGSVQQGVIAQLATGGRGRALQGLPARRHQHRHRPRLGLRWRRAGRSTRPGPTSRSSSLNAVFTGFAAWNSTRLPELPPYVRIEGEPRLAVLRDWPYVVVVADHRSVLDALLRHGARPGALHLRAHVGPTGDGRGPARRQHGGRRALPGPPVPSRRLGRGGRPRPRARRGVDRRRLRDRGAGRPRRRDLRDRRPGHRLAGARGRRDDRLRRPVGTPDGARTARAAGPVPGLRRARLQRGARSSGRPW